MLKAKVTYKGKMTFWMNSIANIGYKFAIKYLIIKSGIQMANHFVNIRPGDVESH